jgi:hypothetical protein
MYIFPECLFNLHYSQKIYKVDSETFVIKKSQIKIDKNNAKYLAFLYALDDYDFLDFNNRIYDYGAWKNYDALKQLLSTLDKNALWY